MAGTESQAAASRVAQARSALVDADHGGRFSWWVAETIPSADLSHAELPILRFGWALRSDGDVSRLSMRNRLQFQFVETMTGEAPPYATLMYVWDNRADLDSVLPGPRSDRVRKIVVESRPATCAVGATTAATCSATSSALSASRRAG